MLSGNVVISNIHLFVLHSPRPFCRHHSQFESDVNTLLGVKDPQLMSIAITGLGGGAYLPASGDKTPAETKGGSQTKTQSSPSPVSIVDTTARCMFFAGLLLPPLLLLLLFFPRPQSVAPVSVRFWRIGEDCAVRSVTRLITDSFYSAALIALLVQVVALLVMSTVIASMYLSIARTQLIVLQGGVAVGLYFLLTLVFNVSNFFFILLAIV